MQAPNKPTHYAMDVSQNPLTKNQLKALKEQDWLIEEAGGDGLLFSNHTLDFYLDEEYRHGTSVLTAEGDVLQTKSSGERKRLLLDYQLQQKPKFLILDHPFDALDVEKVAWFKSKLEALEKDTVLVQLFKRHEDLLPFCSKGLVYEDGEFKKAELQANASPVQHSTYSYEIPAPLVQFKNIPEELIVFKNVSVAFNEKPVLDSITWTVKQGEAWHLKGPNGAGKTTLLSMITGDSTKGYGKELYLFGKKKGSGETVWEIKQKIGYFTAVMTERFDGMHDVRSMIISGLHDSVGLYQKPTTLEIALAENWLKLIGLQDLATARYRTLSEVQKRLVLIARAMVKHPPLLILDEPTSSLNSTGAHLIVSLINKIAGSSTTAVIYVSHREEEGLDFKNKISLLPRAFGSQAEVFKQDYIG